MKTHSDSSFNESKEISILKMRLESNKSIKTFFGENEKTPNHDGFFELVNTNTREPKKQFIVQIKKDDSLSLNKDGSYSFQFDTSFFYYVKEKVTENPAIIFVVELNTEKCFYKYLSDDYLMNLGFENHERITIRFLETDQITNIDNFYQSLLKIADERNAKFIDKTPQQIEEIRIAVEWLNKAMDDIPFLKELIPNFWRFGIASSNSLPLKISILGNKTYDLSNGHDANAFGLYLQCKNKADCGIQEFVHQRYLKPTFDFTNTLTPLKYVKNVFVSLLEEYFNSNIVNPQYLSDKVLNEIVFCMLDKMAYMDSYSLSKPNTVMTYYKDEETVETAKNNLLKFFSFFMHVVNDSISEQEVETKNVFLNALRRNPINNSKVDLIQIISMVARCEFKSWNGNFYSFDDLIRSLKWFEMEYSLFCYAIIELEKRNIVKVYRVWDISHDFYKPSKDLRNVPICVGPSNDTAIKSICIDSVYSLFDEQKLVIAFKRLVDELPNEYSCCYEKIFGRNNSFKYCTDAKAKIIVHENNGVSPYWWELQTVKFSNPKDITISYDETIPTPEDLMKSRKAYSNDILSISSGVFPIDLFDTRLPFYNAIKVFLWQGIMEFYGLNEAINGVIVGNTKCSLF